MRRSEVLRGDLVIEELVVGVSILCDGDSVRRQSGSSRDAARRRHRGRRAHAVEVYHPVSPVFRPRTAHSPGIHSRLAYCKMGDLISEVVLILIVVDRQGRLAIYSQSERASYRRRLLLCPINAYVGAASELVLLY